MRRWAKGLKSTLKDIWILMDTNDRDIGFMKEESTFLALFRRFLSNIIPQTYHGDIGGKTVYMCRQNFKPFVTKITLDFSRGTHNMFDRRPGIASALLLGAIAGKQG